MVAVPVALPQVILPPLGWIGVASIYLAEGQTMALDWLQLQVTAIEAGNLADPCSGSGKHAINPEFESGSLATVLVVKDWSPTTAPWAQTVVMSLALPADSDTAPSAVAPLLVAKTDSPLAVTDFGSYTIVALNNTTNRQVTLSVVGSANLQLDQL